MATLSGETARTDLLAMSRRGVAALVTAGCAVAPLAWAQDAKTLRTRTLAASCAHCHGTDGRVAADGPIPRLAGVPKDQLLAQLIAFRNGARPATVMNQLSRGFTPAQLDEIAGYFAAQH